MNLSKRFSFKSYSWFFLSFLVLIISCNKSVDESNSYSVMELEILQLINQYRILHNLERIEMNSVLFDEAVIHTSYMIEKDKISHDNNSERFSRIKEELGVSSFAENVAFGQKTANELVTAWLNSDSHRQNIEGSYTLTGISAKRNQEGVYFYTQIFTGN
jgi:uncharacterized protein YkwD